MKVSVVMHNGLAIVGLAGELDSRTAGKAYDALVQLAIEGRTGLVVDMAGVTRVTRAGARGLIVAARLVRERRGDMRICRARGSVFATLADLGFGHLLRLDATLAASLAALSPRVPDDGALRRPGAPADDAAAAAANAGYRQWLERISHRR